MSDEQGNKLLEDPRIKYYAKIALTPEFTHATAEEKDKLRDTYFKKNFKDVKKTQEILSVFDTLEFVENSVGVLKDDYAEISTGRESDRLVARDDLKRLDDIQTGRVNQPDYVAQDYFKTASEQAVKSQGERGSYQQRRAGLEERYKMTPEQEQTMRTALKGQQEMGIAGAFGKGITESTIPTFFDDEPHDNYIPTAFWGKGKGGFKGKEVAKDMAYMTGRVMADLPVTFGFMGIARAMLGKQAVMAFMKANPGVLLTPELRAQIAKGAGGEIIPSAVGFGGTSALNTLAQMEMMNKERDMKYAQEVLGDFLIGSLAGGAGSSFGQMTGQFASRLMPNAGKALRGGGLLARVTAEGAIADTIDATARGIDLTPEERLLSLATGALTFGSMEAMNRGLRKTVDYTSRYKDTPEGYSDAEINTQIGRLKYAEDSKNDFIKQATKIIVDKSMARAKDPATAYDLSRKKAIDAVFDNPSLRDILKNSPEMEGTIIGQIDEGIKAKLPHYVTGKAEKMGFNQVANAFFKSKEGRAPEMLTRTTKKGNEKPYSEADEFLPQASDKIVAEMVKRGEVIDTKDYYKNKKEFRDYVTKVADLSEIYTDSPIPADQRPVLSEGARLYGQRTDAPETSPSYMKRLNQKQEQLVPALEKVVKRYVKDSDSFENRQKVENQIDSIGAVAEDLTFTRYTKAEKDIMTNLLTLPEGVMKDIAPKVNLFKWTGLERWIKPQSITNASQIVKRKMGKTVYDLYQAGRTFENVYYKHLNTYRLGLKQLSEKYGVTEKANAALFMLSRQKDGADIFNNMKERERTAVYKLSEKFKLGKNAKLPDELPTYEKLTATEKELVVYFSNEYKKFLDGVNKSREMMGYDKIPEIDGYYPLIRALADGQDAGISYTSTGDELASWVMKNQFQKRASIGKNTWFSKERTGGDSAVLLDPFQALDVYAQSAFKVMDLAPYAKKMQALGEQIGKYNRDAGTFLIDTMKLFSGEFKDATKFREYLMKNANGLTVSYLGYNYNTILTQYSAHKNTIAEFGYRKTLNACAELAQDPNVMQFIYDKSQYMKTRRDSSFDATINEVMQGFGENMFDAVKQNSLIFMKTTDLITSEGAWWTAFKQYERTNGIRQAVIMADDFVTKAHASASKLDLAPIQKKALGKAMTAFQTFAIANWNYLVSDVMGVDPIYKHYRSFDKVDDAIKFVGNDKNKVIHEYDNKNGYAVYDKERTTNFLKASTQMARLMMFNATYNSAMQVVEGFTGMGTSAPGPDPIDSAIEHYYGTKPGRLMAGDIPPERRKDKSYLPIALWKGGLSALKEAPVVGGIEYGGKGLGGAQLQLAQDMADSFARGDFASLAWQLSALKGNPFYNMLGKIRASSKKAQEQEARELKLRGKKVNSRPEKLKQVDKRIKSVNDRVNQRMKR